MPITHTRHGHRMLMVAYATIMLTVFPAGAGECELSGSPGDSVRRLNYPPGVNINLFTTMIFDKVGNVTSFEYFGRRKGFAYVSFWRQGHGTVGKDFTLVGKIGFQGYSGHQKFQIREEDQIMVDKGDMVAVHYGVNATVGVIFYEDDSKDLNFTAGITEDDLHCALGLRSFDDGWEANHIVTFEGKCQKRSVALTIYTNCQTDVLSSSRGKSTNVSAMIIGISVAGGVLFLLLIAVLTVCLYRSMRNRKNDASPQAHSDQEQTDHGYDVLKKP